MVFVTGSIPQTSAVMVQAWCWFKVVPLRMSRPVNMGVQGPTALEEFDLPFGYVKIAIENGHL